MNTNIRNADARRFWEAVYIQTREGYINCYREADAALDGWAARFADEETLSDIEANKARRQMGNEPS